MTKMLKATQEGPVTIFCMGKNIGKIVPYYVHSFLLEDTLIDSGTIYVQDELFSQLKSKPISIIINTHHHEDHIGNNQLLQNRLGAKIYAHPDALYYLNNPKDIKLRFYQRFVWNWPKPSKGQPIGDSIKTPTYTLKSGSSGKCRGEH